MNGKCLGVNYVIKPGDTLYKISRRYKIPLPLLLRANLNVNVYNLIPGQRICIPVFDDDVDNDDDLDDKWEEICDKIPTQDMRNTQSIRNDMMFTNEINATRKHVVGNNESIEALMDMYNVTVEDLFKYNNRNGLLLKEDQVIYMP